MASDHRFALRLLGWAALLALALTALAAALVTPDLGAVRLVAALAAVGAFAGLLVTVTRTNRALARLAEGLRAGDVAQRVDARGGAGFDALGGALNAAMREVQVQRDRIVEELRFWEALVDDLPVALLTVDAEHGVRPANKAARRLFDRHEGTTPAAFAGYGAALTQHLSAGETGAQEIAELRLGGGVQRAVLRSATIARLGVPTRVVAVEPVQAALDAIEVGTQSDLVRVLTHEILNSLTPVTSLAGTAAVLLGEEEPDLAEARLAVLTLARRAEATRRFIDSYRRVARLPEPRRRPFTAGPFADELARLFAVEWIEHRLLVEVDADIVLDADPDLLAQALINLLRNAAQATEGVAGATVRLAIAGGAGGGTRIEVEDNGGGIAPAARGDIFLPFFTTRANGTGIGLNLVRQIAVAHGWRLDVDAAGPLGGARFRLQLAGAAR